MPPTIWVLLNIVVAWPGRSGSRLWKYVMPTPMTSEMTVACSTCAAITCQMAWVKSISPW